MSVHDFIVSELNKAAAKRHISEMTERDAVKIANMAGEKHKVCLKTHWGFLLPAKDVPHCDFCIVLPIENAKFAIGYNDDRLTSQVDKIMEYLFSKYYFGKI